METIRPWCYQRHGQPFQSTPSAWRETIQFGCICRGRTDFNPLPPHGGRPCCIRSFTCSCVAFQSTPSAWRETFPEFLFRDIIVISIHSLRMEGDCHACELWLQRFYFNPLPPHGGRLSSASQISTWKLFQSTPSAWRETSAATDYHDAANVFQSTPSAWRETVLTLFDAEPVAPISIHSLRMEGDAPVAEPQNRKIYFNPLPPHGGRPENRYTH